MTARRVFLAGVLLMASLVGSCASVWLALQLPALTVPGRSHLVLHNVTVVNPGRERKRRQTVVIEGGSIVSIQASAPQDFAEKGDESGDRFVLPGLIDMHVHLPPRWALGHLELFMTLFLAHGVTTVRDMGSPGEVASKSRRDTSEGRLAGPRIISCGRILDGDPPTWWFTEYFGRIVRGAEDASRAVEELASRGADCIKVYSGLSQQALAGIQSAAARRGLPVVGHLPRSSRWSETRVADIQHVCDPRCSRFADWETSQLLSAASEAGLSHTPTLVVYESQQRLYNYDRATLPPSARLLPRFWREIVWSPTYGLGFRRVSQERLGIESKQHAAMVAAINGAVGRLSEDGVAIHAGTDPFNPLIVPGASLHDELRLLVYAGLSVEEAWIAASSRAGQSLRIGGLGTLESGAPADLLVFGDDPTEDLAALSTLETVIADGRVYSRSALEAVLVKQREQYEGWLYDHITMALGRGLTLMARRLEERTLKN